MRPGFVLAQRYRIIGELGRGGMGVVYRAQHLGLGIEVAIKVISPAYLDDTDTDLRFQREAHLSASLRHPNAVPVLDFGRADGYAFIAMALLEGQTLRARIDTQGALPITEQQSIGVQLARALRAAHQVPMVHRDIKPANTFLEPNPDGSHRVVVVDFGLAVQPENLGDLTQHGQIFGSPPYMPPEQATGVPVGPPADIYALGCVLFEMAAGRTPFEGEGLVVLTKHLLEPAPSLQSLVADADPRLVDLLAQMLRKRPDDRPTAADVLTQLEALRSTAAPRATGPSSRQQRMVPATSHEPARDVGGVAIGVATGHLPPEIRLSLLAAGFRVVPHEQAQILLVLGAPDGSTVAWTTRGLPIIADVDPTDVARMSNLARGGVNAVVPRPLSVESVVKAAQRIARRLRPAPPTAR
jgi:serine/threonine-protein kinase